ncbi:MAG: hypothetical protein A3H27_04495 [Acidobacteria bacterium RIFCSPLOWO2_02_FULL_59_13]|nr:MAG: hypothetical protein A3H27_04495 [Acidobacteria bacterium RIFCSPLOWO2_02_FULL_59_13]
MSIWSGPDKTVRAVTRNPLLPIAAAFAAGIGTAPHFYLSAPERLLLLGIIVLGAAWLLRLGRNAHSLLLSLAGFFLCGTFLAAAEHAYLPPQHIASLARRGVLRPDQPARLTGWARTPSLAQPRWESFDLALTQVEQNGRPLPAQGIVRVYYFPNRDRPVTLDISYGTPLSFPVRDLREPRNFLTPGSYDFEAARQRQGIYFTGVVRDLDQLQLLTGRSGSRLMAFVFGLRTRLLSALDRLYPAERDSLDRAAILKAMLLGEDSWLSPATEITFQQSGIYHVLVVSGLHVGALALGLFWLLSLFRVSQWTTTLLVTVCLVGYALLSGSGTPVVRATLMVLLYLTARLIYRERALLNSIAAAALLLLILHPSDLWDGSFVLSFLAVLVLASVALPVVQWTLSPYRQALRELDATEKDLILEPRQAQFRHDIRTVLNYFCDPSRLGQRRWRMLRAALLKVISAVVVIAEAAVFVFFMQIGFSLAMAVFFHRVSWSGIVANLVVVPLTPLLIVGGFLVLLLSLVWWPAASVGAYLLGLLVFALRVGAGGPARLAGWSVRVPSPPLWVWLGFLAVLLATAVLVARKSRWTWVSAAALVGFAVVLTLAPYSPQQTPDELELTALDVNQGDSLFLSFPGGRTMLIDGGGAIPMPGQPPPSLDIGESVVSSYLWSRRLKALDYVVLTHAHWDHTWGLISVLKNFPVRELWLGPGPSNYALKELLQVADARGVPVVRLHSGLRRGIDGVPIAILSPPAAWNPSQVGNNDSLVLQLSYGQRSLLLAGDVESRMENAMLKDGFPLASDILKVAHHGSRSSTTVPFLHAVSPAFGVISVGPYRRFGHPHEEVLETLRRAGVHTYRTDTDGTITARTNGNRIELETFRWQQRDWAPFNLHPGAGSLLSRQ